MSLWRTIAKNEIRLKTSRFRKNRRLFFILIYTIFLFWAAYLGPVFLDAILPEILKVIIEEYQSIFIALIEYLFSTLFLMYILYPLLILFRKTEINNKEILIAAPIKSGDIFLGEFFGKLPFYFLFILGIGPFGTTLLIQINHNLTIFHHLVFYISFFTMSMFGSLIGMIISKWVELKVSTIERRKNLELKLLLLISFSVITVYYLLHFLFDFIIVNPEFKNYLIFYPSFWYSNIILYFVNSMFIESYLFNIWTNIALATFIPLLIFYISYNKANKFYEITFQNQKTSVPIKYEKKYSQFIRKCIPKKYEGLVIIQFKVFFRKKENIIKLFYTFGIIAVLGIVILFNFDSQNALLEEFLSSLPIVIQITLNKNFTILIIAWLGGFIVGILMGMQTIIDSKDLLHTYKKSLRGVKALIYSYLYNIIYLILILDIFLTILFWFIFKLDLVIIIVFFITFLISSNIIILQAIGIQCIRPLFEEQRGSMLFYNYVVILLQIISLQITFYIFIPIASAFIDPSVGFLIIFIINLGISSGFSFLMLYLGIRKLNKIE